MRYENGRYELKYEKQPWWAFYRKSDSAFHYTGGDSIFCYASVFAPTKLALDIYHRWEYYDEDSSIWKEHGRFTYAIKGGRDDGYRGYTVVGSLQPGKWRCTVETERGQALGRETFTVVEGAEKELVTRID